MPEQASQDRVLPRIRVQQFGMVLVLAVLAAGLFGKGDSSILLAVLATGGGFVLLGGFYERARYEVEKALNHSETHHER